MNQFEPHRPDQDDGTAPEKPSIPRPLRLARTLWVVSALIGAVHEIVQLADRRQITVTIQQLQPGLSQGDVDSAVSSTVLLGFVFALLVLGVYVLLSWRMAQGYQWARVVLTVFGGFSVVLNAIGLLGMLVGSATGAMQAEALQVLASVVTLVLDATALVLMFRSESNRYFRDIAALRPKTLPRTF